MGVHASVYCNCYETGRLRIQPPRPDLIYVEDNGCLSTRGLEDFKRFYAWLEGQPCDHEMGVAVFHPIGNIARVSFLREQLQKERDSFPLILSKVLYDGTHGGDFIPVEVVEDMRTEIAKLHHVHLVDPVEEGMFRLFEDQITELVRCSLEMRKPISF